MTLLGSYTITVPVGVVSSVRLRLRTAAGAGPASAAKVAKPTNGVVPPPEIEVAPRLVSAPCIGEAVQIEAGRWFNAETVVTTLYLDGIAIAQPYTLRPEDDGAVLTIEDVATGPGGTTSHASEGVAVVRPAPSLDAIADITATEGDASPTIQVTGIGLAGGAWSISGNAAASIDANGLITISTTAPTTGAVTVQYANSGGAATRTFFVTVAGGLELWTPADLSGDFFVMRFDDAALLTIDGTGHLTAARSAYGASFTPTAIAAAPYDAVAGALDLTAKLGVALDGALPFTLAGPRDLAGAGDDIANAITVLWVATDATTGIVANTRAGSLGRYRTGGSEVFGTSSVGAGWNTAGAQLRIASLRYDGSTRTAWSWRNGVPVLAGATIISSSQSGTTHDGLSIGANSDGSAPANGKLHALAVIRGWLSPDDRAKFEGWLAWTLPALGADGSVLPPEHKWKHSAPFLSAPPQPFGDAAPVALHEGVWMDPLDLRGFWIGATGFSATDLPEGLTIQGNFLTGKPRMAGTSTCVITAANADGFTPRSFEIIVAAAPVTAATSAMEVWAKAASTSVGGAITISDTLTRVADPTLETLSTLSGDTALTLIGYTDFRDGAPADLDYDSRRAVAYTDASGNSQTTTAASTTPHPMFSGSSWLDASEISAALPIDHMPGGAPAGLALGAVEAKTANGFGHNGLAHVGHIIWLAEYEMADG